MRYGARSDDTYSDMENASSENHAAAAWVAGHMNAVQRQEFETHLANCAHCQEEVSAMLAKALQPPEPPAPIKVEVEPPVAPGGARRAAQVAIAGLVTLIVGFAIGWWIWQMAHH
jgi:anti-sigma factor RsiW